jgi:hypothetical protein
MFSDFQHPCTSKLVPRLCPTLQIFGVLGPTAIELLTYFSHWQRHSQARISTLDLKLFISSFLPEYPAVLLPEHMLSRTIALAPERNC